jgi:hypothetical protein
MFSLLYLPQPVTNRKQVFKEIKMIRFSKENVVNELQNQIAKMEQIWGFVSDNGTNQIKDKSDFDRVVAYGEYRALVDICQSIYDNTLLNI